MQRSMARSSVLPKFVGRKPFTFGLLTFALAGMTFRNGVDLD